MSKFKKDCNPFYVDVGTSIVAIRCASNHDVIVTYDHVRFPYIVKLAEEICDRMNREAAIWKEEDAKYKYEIHGKYEGKWLTEDRSEMSNAKHETIADIVREIRKKHPAEEYPAEYGGGEVPNRMRKLADRIEAAWNRRVK